MAAPSHPAVPSRRLHLGRPALVLAAIWALGLIALASIVVFERRVDETRHAQVVIAEMRNQQGTLISVAFEPGVAGVNDTSAHGRDGTAARGWRSAR